MVTDEVTKSLTSQLDNLNKKTLSNLQYDVKT
jgi:hypothetical protein